MNDQKEKITERYEKRLTQMRYTYDTEIENLKKQIEFQKRENKEIVRNGVIFRWKWQMKIVNLGMRILGRKCGKVIDELRKKLNSQHK